MHTVDGTDADRGISCVDCHGGDGTTEDKERAHVHPRWPEVWKSTANPVRSFTTLNRERPEFIQFINPGDLRVADRACGGPGCHDEHVRKVRKSMMTHGAMLWGAALYNNGGFPLKDAHFGEGYGAEGLPQQLATIPLPTFEQTHERGLLPFLDPLPRWEITQMGNILRVFERGGGPRTEIANPNRFEESGRPDVKLSNRGLGTLLRTDPVFLGLQKTRLLDPMLSFLGTNDHPGDYRSGGCTACHVIYANDSNPLHAGAFAEYGHLGQGQSRDRAMQRELGHPNQAERPSGHPIRHQMTVSIPSSQCVSCHHHPGTTVTNTYLGYTWWDNETHGELMYPKQQRNPTLEEEARILLHNPEGAAVRGKWGEVSFLKPVGKLNSEMNRTQFADFTPHGWLFRAVFKQNRKGELLDAQGRILSDPTPGQLHQAISEPFRRRGAPVHLRDIHLERGMHCVDCHFTQDVHGNGNLYGETRNAVEIDCRDCHGTTTRRISGRRDLRTTGPAAPQEGTNLAALRTPFGERRFDIRDGVLIQRSMVTRGLEWPVPQVADTVDPSGNRLASYAHTLQKDGRVWGKPVASEFVLAHGDHRMACYTCHTSWTTSCFGCHLKMQANRKMPQLHNEGGPSRNWTSYNFQTLRDDVFMLGKDATVPARSVFEFFRQARAALSLEKCRRTVPTRSSCAVYVSSQNQNREWLYFLQQTVSAEGFSGQAFNPHVPHTVGGTTRSGRRGETKMCSDCHVSEQNDNNAWLAQVLMHGTNLTNFIGRNVFVAEGEGGVEAVVVSERDEPQAVIGSRLHELAYPDNYRRHLRQGARLREAYHHEGFSLGVQARGEYLYSAEGPKGVRIYDIANLDNKGFSERITTAPVSPAGQQFYVRTKCASAVASPSTMAVDPARYRMTMDGSGTLRSRAPGSLVPGERWINEEQPIHPLYAYLYVADREEGLILLNAATLLDGSPTNNFLRRSLTWNEGGVLRGARSLVLAGNYMYVCCDRGLVVLRIDRDPAQGPLALRLRQVAELGDRDGVIRPVAVGIQFRYVFICDAEGLKVADISDPEHPRAVDLQEPVRIVDARGIYLARTYAYVAAGKQGLVVVDIEKPEQPRIDQVFSAQGAMNDVHDVKIAMTNASAYAYVADGHNGLRVVQLFSPQETPTYLGFSPRPAPRLIATYRTRGPALAVSEGIDRDRAVDESGNQVGVFGRRGSRPLHLDEQRQLYVRNGRLYTVSDDPRDPTTGPQDSKSSESTNQSVGLLWRSKMGPGPLVFLQWAAIALVCGIALAVNRARRVRGR